MNKRVIIMVGLPGSGKSTWIKAFRERFEGTLAVVSADDYFMRDGVYNFDPTKLPKAHEECFRSFVYAVDDAYEVVIVDNTNIRAEHSQPYIDCAVGAGYDVHEKFIYCTPDVAYKSNTHGVPLETIERLYEQLLKRGYNDRINSICKIA